MAPVTVVRPAAQRLSSFRWRIAAFLGLAAGLLVALCGRSAWAGGSSTTIANGYDMADVESPRALGMGGGLAAVGTSTVALYQNPADMGLSRVYHFEGEGAYSPEARRYNVGGAIVDSATGRFAGGLGLNFGMLDPSGIHRSWTDLRMALSYQFGEYVGFGVAARYLGVDQAPGVGPFGDSLISSGTPSKALGEYLTLDTGLTVTPTPGLHVAVVGRNLTDPGVSLAPTTVVGAVGYDSHTFALEADVLGDFTTWQKDQVRVMTGAELFVEDHVPLRIGYRYDQGMNTHAVSAGIGYVGQIWSIEYSLRQDVAGSYPSTMMSLSIRYFYDSTGNNTMSAGSSF
jgi:opacity protein-like surface antigen